MAATVIQMPTREAGETPRILLGDGAMPVSADEAKYCADRKRVATWRSQCLDRQQWRRDSAKAIEYWDGNQFDSYTAALYRERGIPLIAHNCIKRWINSVVGMQERNLTDGLVKLEDSNFQALELALGQELKEAERMTRTDRACLDALDTMIKGGIGWVEVGTNDDPFEYPDRVEIMPWREMYWDRSAVKADLSDSNWFRRARFYSRDDLMLWFSQDWQQQIIEKAGTESDTVSWFEPERLERDERWWRDPNRWSSYGQPNDAVALSENRYRVWVQGYVVDTPGGPQVFDPQNPDHMAAYQAGFVQPRAATYRRVRQSFWLGPHCLVDRWNPVPNHEVGWVPFICYIEDQTGSPYGLIRDMIALQDEINATKAKAHWSLDSTTIIADDDRIMNWDDAREAVNRRDGAIQLNPAARNGYFELDRHAGMTEQQYKMHTDAVNKIGYVHGLDDPFAGSPNTKDQSGVALQTLAAQSINCLGKPIAHYSEARRKVLDLLLTQRIARIGGAPHPMRYKDRDGTAKTVVVNVPVQLADGSQSFLSLPELKRQVVLDETPSTPTYRAQQFKQIVETLRAMPPEAQAILLPAMFEMSDLPSRDVYADMARQMLGLAGPKNEAEALEAQRKAELAARGEEATVALAEAKAASEGAKAEETVSKIDERLAKIEKMLAERDAIRQDIEHQDIALAGGGPDKLEGVLRW